MRIKMKTNNKTTNKKDHDHARQRSSVFSPVSCQSVCVCLCTHLSAAEVHARVHGFGADNEECFVIGLIYIVPVLVVVCHAPRPFLSTLMCRADSELLDKLNMAERPL